MLRFGNSKVHFSPNPLPQLAAVDSLFSVAPIFCGGYVFGSKNEIPAHNGATTNNRINVLE